MTRTFGVMLLDLYWISHSMLFNLAYFYFCLSILVLAILCEQWAMILWIWHFLACCHNVMFSKHCISCKNCSHWSVPLLFYLIWSQNWDCFVKGPQVLSMINWLVSSWIIQNAVLKLFLDLLSAGSGEVDLDALLEDLCITEKDMNFSNETSMMPSQTFSGSNYPLSPKVKVRLAFISFPSYGSRANYIRNRLVSKALHVL